MESEIVISIRKIFFFAVALTIVFLTNSNLADASTAPNQVSVKLINYLGNKNEVSLNIHGTYSINGSNVHLIEGNSYKVKVENSTTISLYANGTKVKVYTNSFTINPVKYGVENYVSINNRDYLGDFTFTIENGSYVRPINRLPMEDYLKGVVPGEMPASWHVEALQAQAVAARTYALAKINSTIVDTVTNQVYSGYIWKDHNYYKNSTLAVNHTKGEVLTYGGKLISAVYSSSNGGITESNANLWGGTALGYLPAKNDPYDPQNPWKLQITETQIDDSSLNMAWPASWWRTVVEKDPLVTNYVKNWLKANGYANKDLKIAKITGLTLGEEKTSGGRRMYGGYRIEFFVKDGVDGPFRMKDGKLERFVAAAPKASFGTIRSMFGGSYIKSHLVDRITYQNGIYTYEGRGFGHGIGMSQYGAKKMADLQKSHKEILGFYYPSAVEDNYIDSMIQEIGGKNRYETSVNISKYGWNDANTVVIGRGDNPIDALTGSVLAKKHNAPLLLVNTDSLPDSVTQLLNQYKPGKILILGGEKAVSNKVETSLRAYTTNIERITGQRRYETAIKVASEVGAASQVFITSDSSESPDALSIAPYASAKQIPILYTQSGVLTPAVKDFLVNAGTKKVTIIGGTGAVSEGVEASIAALVGQSNVDRVSGKNRYVTSINIMKTYNIDPRNVFFAQGEEFIDALPGSVLAANFNGPIILVQKNSVPQQVIDYLAEDITFIPQIHYLGGEGAISRDVRNVIENTILH
nr:SpoIID/LytB domain-containing protein [Bacillus sp. ISL-37]